MINDDEVTEEELIPQRGEFRNQPDEKEYLPPVQQSIPASGTSDLGALGQELAGKAYHEQAVRRARAAYDNEPDRSLELEQLQYGAWAPSAGVVRAAAGMIPRQEEHFWTDELYDELVAPLAGEQRDRVLDANTEEEARDVLEHFRRAEQMNLVWQAEVDEGGIPGIVANTVLQMLDPGSWAVGGVAFKTTSALLKGVSLTAGIAAKIGTESFSKYYALQKGIVNAGIYGAADAFTGGLYMTVAQKGNPVITDEAIQDYIFYGGLFGGGLGFLGGVKGGLKVTAHHKAMVGTRLNHNNMFLGSYGPKLHQLFENILRETPETRAGLVEQLKNIREMALRPRTGPQQVGGATKEGVKRSALSIEPTRSGPGGTILDDAADELGVTAILNDLSPQELTNFWKDVSKGLELRQAERAAELAVRRMESEHVLGLSKQDIKELTKNAEVGKDTVDSLLAAQAALLKETDKVGVEALSRVVEGQGIMLDNVQIKWLANNRPEVFGKNGVDIDALIKARKLDGETLLNAIKDNMKRLEDERALLGKREFKQGDIIMTEDGRVGRIGEMGEGGKFKVESFAYAETSRMIKETEKKIASAERFVSEGKARPELVGRRAKLADLEKQLKTLKDELLEMDVSDVFEAPVGVSARFTMAEDIGFTRPSKWTIKDTDRYALGKTKKGTKQKGKGAPKKLQGMFYGENITLTSSLSAGKGAAQVPVEGRIWTLKFGGRQGNAFIVHSEGWWDHQIATGKIKVTDVEYRTRTQLQDGGSQKALMDQVDAIVRKEVLARYEAKVISKNNARHLELSRVDDPVNLLDELAEGRVPKELREMLGEDFSEDALGDWARSQKALGDDVVEKLKRGETVPTLDDQVKGMDINDPSAPRLDPFTAWMSGKIFGINSVNVWGLTHDVGAIRRLWSMGFGSWYSLVDPVTGKVMRAGGEADSIFAGGAMNFRKMEVKSRLAPYVTVLSEEVANFKRVVKGNPLAFGRAEGELMRHVKRYLESGGSLVGVPKGAEKSVARVAKQFQESIADMLTWAKKNGVDELKGVTAHDKYVPRYRDHAMMEKIVNTHGQRELDDTLKRSLIAANQGMSQEAAELIAKKLRRYYMQASGGRPLNDSMLGMKNESIEDFMDALDNALASTPHGVNPTDELAGPLTSKQRAVIKKAFGEGTSVTGHAKKRMELDMGVTTNKKIDGRHVPVSELFETNMTAVLERYMIDLVSKAQEHALVKSFHTENYKPQNLDELLAHIEDRVGEVKINSGEVSKQLQAFKKYMRNEPQFERDTLSSMAAVVRQWATILKLPGFVPAQFPEATTAYFSTGFFPKLLRRMPILNTMVDDALKGRISKESAAKFVHFNLGMGTIEHELGMLYAYHELIEEGSTLVSGKVIGRMYGYQSQLIPRISKWSGFRQINSYSDLVAHRNFTDELVGASKTGNRQLFNEKRLASYGLNQRDFEDVLDALRQEGVVTTEGIRGTDIYTLNFEKMEASAGAKYRTMAAANIRQVVQRSHTWDQPLALVGSPWGEFLTQFRTFSISSMNNHFARNLQAADKWAFSQVSTMFVGGLATHYAMSYLNFHDDPERLAEALDTTNWVKGALIRSGFMGMIPDFIDLPFSALTGKTIFSPSDRAMLLSIPVFDTVRDLADAGGTAFKMFTGQDTFGKEDYVFRKSIPGTNLLYWRVLAETIIPDDTPFLGKL